MTESIRLLNKVVTHLHLAGVTPVQGSINPLEALLWEIEDYLLRVLGEP